MDRLGRIISEPLFFNAFEIIQEYVHDSKDFIQDLNLRLIKPAIQKLDNEKIRRYYKKYIAKDLFYLLPELFSSDIVSIPKKLSGVREYRFLSTYSYILYNAVGLLFIECCDELIRELNFSRKGVHVFRPTTFEKTNNKWKAQNNYKNAYVNFKQKIDQELDCQEAILVIDISDYFGSINHKILIDTLKKYSKSSKQAKHKLSKESFSAIEFYFKSLMGRNTSIPQGKKNFVSDFFGHLYLVPFDLNISEIIQSELLEFKSLIRYVDDITLVLRPKKNVGKALYLKELVKIEQQLSTWLSNNLSLTTNGEKTKRELIFSDYEKKSFVEAITKRVSSLVEPPTLKKSPESSSSAQLNSKLEGIMQVLSKMQFPDSNTFKNEINKEDTEKLKVLFDKRFSDFICMESNIETLQKLLSDVDIELTSDSINILIKLFSLKPYNSILTEKLKHSFDNLDKNILHIIAVSLADEKKIEVFSEEIKNHYKKLQADNYGKYILVNVSTKIKFLATAINHSLLYINRDLNIFNRIREEYLQEKKTYKNLSCYYQDSIYLKFLMVLIAAPKLHDYRVIQQLKEYVHAILDENYHLSFNYLHNAFHEICKLTYKLKDKDTVKQVIASIQKYHASLSMEEELELIKFYDRRNFNLISHPSQRGAPSSMANQKDVEYFGEFIFKLLPKIIKSSPKKKKKIRTNYVAIKKKKA